jgi:hypothetical protein
MPPSLALLPPEPDEAGRARPGSPPELFLVERSGSGQGPPAGQEQEPELDPAKAAEGLARSVLEVLAGARDLQQLTRWVTTEVHAVLQTRVQISARARTVLTARPVRPVLRVGTVKISRPVPGVVEAVVVVHGRGRARAVAVRLEVAGARWQASALHIL